MAGNDPRAWLPEAILRHQRLTPAVVGLLENVLTRNRIDYLSVVGRTKDASSAEEKIRRKKYNQPQVELTDLSGIRIITFLETQVKAISEVIRSAFEVDEKNSLDRSTSLGDDKIGYRSTHFVCSLGANRKGLLEYESLSELKFEIQVRTVLQHAWAELAHDRSFKLGTGLPTKIQRKLNLYSGMLELVDGAFDDIAREVDEYRAAIAQKTPTQLTEIELNSLSIQKYLAELAEENDLNIPSVEIPNDILDEFRAFGLHKIKDLKAIAHADPLSFLRDHPAAEENTIGFIRSLMMYHDIDRYFKVWTPWSVLDATTAALLEQKYSREKLRQLFSAHEVVIDPESKYQTNHSYGLPGHDFEL
ncbi:GTP pyrophosphokinase [Bradyrhizobium oligotrophicum S58]